MRPTDRQCSILLIMTMVLTFLDSHASLVNKMDEEAVDSRAPTNQVPLPLAQGARTRNRETPEFPAATTIAAFGPKVPGEVVGDGPPIVIPIAEAWCVHTFAARPGCQLTKLVLSRVHQAWKSQTHILLLLRMPQGRVWHCWGKPYAFLCELHCYFFAFSLFCACSQMLTISITTVHLQSPSWFNTIRSHRCAFPYIQLLSSDL